MSELPAMVALVIVQWGTWNASQVPYSTVYLRKQTNLQLNSCLAVVCDIWDSGNDHAVKVKPRAERTVRTRAAHHGRVRFESVNEHIRRNLNND